MFSYKINKGSKTLHFFVLLLLLILSRNSQAQKVIEINDATVEFIFQGEYFEILEDKEKKWTLHDVTTDPIQSKFILNRLPYAYNENIKSAYWIKFRVKNNARSGKNFLLESYSPHTNDLQFYIPSGDHYNLKRSGINLDFYEREYINKNIIFDIPLDTSKVETFYLRIESSNFSSFDFRIKPVRYFTYYSVNEYYFLGMFYGILIIMAIYNLLMFLSVREKVYIYYVLYIMCGILTTLADDSLGYQYVWFKFSHINSFVGGHLAPNLLLLTFVIYSREFLQLKTSNPKFDKIIIWVTLGYFCYYFLAITVLPASLNFRGVYVLPFIFIYIVAFKCLSDGYKPARFFVIGYTFIFISIVIIKLRSNGSIEGNLFTVYSLNYGLVLEVIVLSFALADRFKFNKKERENALKERAEAQNKAIKQLRINQELKDEINNALEEKSEAQKNIIEQLKITEELKDKVNKELEAKVAERTQELNSKNTELQEANIKLKELTDKANQMSLKLDVDNWDLQKKVKEAIGARMMGREVSYEEFMKIFPDESSCFRYLHELKWDEGYVCKKCKNKECVDDGFAKKCSRCAYYESVTAHTLFHGVKFPIHKAFYIAYLMVHKKDKITLDELSALLDLRRNTCWKFKNKIFLAIELFQKKHNTEIIKSWLDIIFVERQKKKPSKENN